MWHNPYANPDPRAAVDRGVGVVHRLPALAHHPARRVVPRPRWATRSCGTPSTRSASTAIHTGPVKRAGGITGWEHTPSVDGHFDRISTQIDPAFGTEDEFRTMCATRERHGGTVIDDIVPGHTGKGADFRLAEMAYEDYPGIYHMVEIDPRDWHQLPDVPAGRDSVNLDAADRGAARQGRLHHRPAAARHLLRPASRRPTGAPRGPCVGVDGVERRWVYLHYFKDGQPSINWLDPTFAGMRLVMGDALHSLADLGTGALRLDANGFLGVEKSAAEGSPAWSEGHPLSEAANHLIASMVRKVGGFTFQELNLTIDDIRDDRPRPARTCPTTSSTAPPTSTRWRPVTPSSCG